MDLFISIANRSPTIIFSMINSNLFVSCAELLLEMGCASSKTVTWLGCFKEKVSHNLKGANDLEGLLTSNNGGDQFLALLCIANTVARRFKAGLPMQ